MNAGLSQNLLCHSFMSASLSNETQRRFLMRKHLCAAGRHGMLESAKMRLEENSFECAGGKSCANSGCVGMLSLSFEK